jgi:hypothetical protein
MVKAIKDLHGNTETAQNYVTKISRVQERLRVRVILKNVYTPEQLEKAVGIAGVPINKQDKGHVLLFNRGHAQLVLWREDHVDKLIRASNSYVKFIRYKHVDNIEGYSILKIYGYLATANKQEIMAATEALLKVQVIGGAFGQMMHGEAYLNFQESQTYLNELIISHPFVAILGLSFTFAKPNIRMENLNVPNPRVVFFRGLGHPINEDEFRQILWQEAGKYNSTPQNNHKNLTKYIQKLPHWKSNFLQQLKLRNNPRWVLWSSEQWVKQKEQKQNQQPSVYMEAEYKSSSISHEPKGR